MTANSLRFTIGELSVAITGGKQYSVSGPYRKFFDSITAIPESVDFNIDISPNKAPLRLSPTECLFQSGGAWTLYKDDTGHTIIISGQRELIIDKPLRHGRLYAETQQNGDSDSVPFFYPLDIVLVISLLPYRSGVLVHACGIDDTGQGLLFLGTSGAGKSTTARLWADETGVKVLSDDRIIIREINNSFIAYGTPWHGELNVCDPGSVAIEKMFFLEQSDRNYAKPLSPVEAATRMFVRCFPTFWDKKGMEFTLSVIDRVVSNVPCYELGFVADRSAVSFVRGLE